MYACVLIAVGCLSLLANDCRCSLLVVSCLLCVVWSCVLFGVFVLFVVC